MNMLDEIVELHKVLVLKGLSDLVDDVHVDALVKTVFVRLNDDSRIDRNADGKYLHSKVLYDSAVKHEEVVVPVSDVTVDAEGNHVEPGHLEQPQ